MGLGACDLVGNAIIPNVGWGAVAVGVHSGHGTKPEADVLGGHGFKIEDRRGCRWRRGRLGAAPSRENGNGAKRFLCRSAHDFSFKEKMANCSKNRDNVWRCHGAFCERQQWQGPATARQGLASISHNLHYVKSLVRMVWQIQEFSADAVVLKFFVRISYASQKTALPNSKSTRSI